MSFRVQLINMGTRAAACEYSCFSKSSASISKMAASFFLNFSFFPQSRLSYVAFMIITNVSSTILCHYLQALISPILSSTFLKLFSVSIRASENGKSCCMTFLPNHFPAVLKDVRNSPLDMIKDPDMDQTRMASYPNLEYQNLYNAICMLVSLVLFA